MKLNLISVTEATGTAKASGNPFQMLRANHLEPLEAVNTQNYQLMGKGFSVVETDVSQDFYESLSSYFIQQYGLKKSLVLVDVETRIVQRGRNSSTLITGWTESFAKKIGVLENQAA